MAAKMQLVTEHRSESCCSAQPLIEGKTWTVINEIYVLVTASLLQLRSAHENR